MSQVKKNILNALSGIIVGGFFLYLTLKNKPVGRIIELLSEARITWILLSIILLVIMFFFRAFRWKLLLENNNYHSGIRNVSYSLLLGFFINSFTPKLGEIIRCTSLQQSSGIPVSKSFGTVISERIYDLIALLAGIIIIIILEFGRLRHWLGLAVSGIRDSVSSNLSRMLIFATAAIILTWVLILIFRRYSVWKKIRSFFGELWMIVKNTFRIKSYGLFIFQTVIIWFLMVLMNYCCLRSLPSTESLDLYFAFIVLFIGTIGWAIPSPGGMGTTHFFVLQLFLLFNMQEETGVAYGILVNGITVLFTIAGGLLAILAVNIVKFVRKSASSGA